MREDFPVDVIRAVEALASEQDKKMSDWHAIFDLARRLKSFADQPFTLETAVRAYCSKSGRSFDETWIAVQAKWDLVRTPEGGGDWDWACGMARTHPLTFRPERGEKYELAASLAHYLSLLNPQFALGVEKLGEFLGMSARTGTDVIRLLLKDKVVEVAADADRRARKAREYRMVENPVSREEGRSTALKS